MKEILSSDIGLSIQLIIGSSGKQVLLVTSFPIHHTGASINWLCEAIIHTSSVVLQWLAEQQFSSSNPPKAYPERKSNTGEL